MEAMDAVIQWLLTNATGFIQWFGNLFTTAEWRTMIWLVLATFVFTHFAKIAWRLFPIPGGGNHNAIHLLAGLIGFWLAFWLWPAGQVPWWIAGPVVGGGGAVGLFKAFFPLLGLICPRCAAMFNADRRKVWGLPPKDRRPWRKEDG